MTTVTLASVERAAKALGLALRGAFHTSPDDAVPEVHGAPARTLVLLGNVGGSMWPAVVKSGFIDGRADPVDDWSHSVVGRLAGELGARALYPFGGPPFLPFLRWAQRAEPVFPSRMGPLIHPAYGLWHAYRGALALRERLELPPPPTDQSPCERCADQPCLSTCPVDAMTPGRYDVKGCVAHAGSPSGVECLELGCAARRACPVGERYIYSPEQATHHMGVFIRNVRSRSEE